MKREEFNIKSVEEAIKIMETVDEDSDRWHEAFLYMLKFGSPEFKAKAREGFKRFFGLEVTHYDDQGNAFYDLSEVKKILNVDDKDITDNVNAVDMRNAKDLHQKQ